jgi:hypothetical protein
MLGSFELVPMRQAPPWASDVGTSTSTFGSYTTRLVHTFLNYDLPLAAIYSQFEVIEYNQLPQSTTNSQLHPELQ